MERKTAPKNHNREMKPAMSLIPMDVLEKYLVPAYAEGALKYERESWRDGFPLSVMIDALQRHITAFFYRGEDFDPDAEQFGVKKHHLGAAMFCLMSMAHTLDTRPDLDDRHHKSKDSSDLEPGKQCPVCGCKETIGATPMLVVCQKCNVVRLRE